MAGPGDALIGRFSPDELRPLNSRRKYVTMPSTLPQEGGFHLGLNVRMQINFDQSYRLSATDQSSKEVRSKGQSRGNRTNALWPLCLWSGLVGQRPAELAHGILVTLIGDPRKVTRQIKTDTLASGDR